MTRLLVTIGCTFASPFTQEEVRVKRQGMSLQESVQHLQNMQQMQSLAQQGSQQNQFGESRPQGSTPPGGFLSDPNFIFSSGSNNRRPSGSGNNNQGFTSSSGSGNQNSGGSNNQRPTGSDFDAFNGPGFGGGNQGSGGSGNQQRPGSGNQQRPGSANQGSGGSGGSTSGNGNQQQILPHQSTTVRSPINVVSNENTIPEAPCVQTCLAVSTYDPICGSDSITYTNRAKFRCAQQCGRRVTEAYRGACVTNNSSN